MTFRGLNKVEKAQFDRAVATLNRIREQVEMKSGNERADVSFYLDGSGTLHLMVADMHRDITQGDIAHEGRLENAGGGDW